ncbi:MAG TPA: NAD(P)-dependent oxidoreductase [Gaiellaceae bacterium]|nr:NAD(P)-dependent oxidoreductase [Gaiellaceae bacterium]
MRIVLTGATGFIGSNLLDSLAADHDVFALGRVPARGRPGVRWIEHDLSRPLGEARLPSEIDAVVHLAQSRRYRDFPTGAEDIFALNVRATFELLEYARNAGAARFVFTSTGGVYGHGDESFLEDDRVNPINFYLASKYAAETVIAPFVSELNAIVLRPFFVYGPGQGAMLVSTFAQRVVANEPITIFGNPGIRINPIYVDDAVRALRQALQHPSSLLCNVAGNETVTLTALVQLLGNVVGETPRVKYVEADHDGDVIGDTKRMRTELGVEPEINLREGLERLVESLR